GSERRGSPGEPGRQSTVGVNPCTGLDPPKTGVITSTSDGSSTGPHLRGEAGTAPKRPPIPRPEAGEGSMAKVLIVDETELFLKLEHTLLRRSGFDLAKTSDPDAIMRMARDFRPDLVLLHAEAFHGMCGSPCARRIKSDPGLTGIPILLLQGAGAEPTGDPLPGVRVLRAPWEEADFSDAVRELIGISTRSARRTVAALPVRVGGRAHGVRGRTKDLSAEGLFIRSRHPIPEDTLLPLDIHLEGADGPRVIRGCGRVVRRVEEDRISHRVSGCALRLVDLEDRS